MWKKMLLIVGALALLTASWWLWELYSVLRYGVTRREPIGGHWEVRYRDNPADHSGGEAALERKREGRIVVIDEPVQIFRYMDDDCVLYSVSRRGDGPQNFAACGDLRPLPLTSASYDEWNILPDGLQKIEFVGEVKKPTVKIPWAEIKPRAMAQPLSPLNAGSAAPR